jgi:hypothetical protein
MGQWSRPIDCTRADSILIYISLLSFYQEQNKNEDEKSDGPPARARPRGPVRRITDILNERRSISADTTSRLGRYFGNRPQFWLDLQSQYDLAVAEREPRSQSACAPPPRPEIRSSPPVLTICYGRAP